MMLRASLSAATTLKPVPLCWAHSRASSSAFSQDIRYAQLRGKFPYRVYTVFSRVLIYLERTHCFYLLRTYGFALTSRSVEMDLDVIQDLLGGTNLPPPPSVQDLLGDVVPVARSPTPPTPPAPQRLTAEHSYSKVATFIIGRVDSFLCVLNSAV